MPRNSPIFQESPRGGKYVIKKIFWISNKTIIEFGFRMTVKNYADLGGCYPPQPSASVDNILLDLHNSSHPTLPRSIIVNCRTFSCSPSIRLSKSPCFPCWLCDFFARAVAARPHWSSLARSLSRNYESSTYSKSTFLCIGTHVIICLLESSHLLMLAIYAYSVGSL